MIPFQAVLTPLFLEMHFLGLLNNLGGLVLFYTTFNLPVGVYIMRNSFLQVPGELVDAARVDGASVMTTLLSVYRPLIMPRIATAALHAFLFSWTEFLGALSFLTDDKLFARSPATGADASHRRPRQPQTPTPATDAHVSHRRCRRSPRPALATPSGP
jgi:ABC-type glycerol-3-phosphate transport system permease component